MTAWYLILIVAFANNLFYLTPYSHVPGVFRMTDVGIALILMGCVYYMVRGRGLGRLRNFFTGYIAAYLLFVLIQAAVATMNYGQTIMDGIIQARHQFYYLAFPVFVLALDSRKKVEQFMRIATWVAVVVVVLSVINYFGIILFHFKWAEGQGIRSGIVRAFVPAMDLLAMVAIWQFLRSTERARGSGRSFAFFAVMFAAIVFRQTRGRLIALCAALGLALVRRRRFKTLMLAGFGLVFVVAASSVLLGKNILFSQLSLAFQNVAHGTGTWHDRLVQISETVNVFWQNLWLGSGGLVIRTPDTSQTAILAHGAAQTALIAYGADLGYWTWLKYFGVPGIALLAINLAGLLALLRRAERRYPGHPYVAFAGYHSVTILISMVTIDYYVYAPGILMLCLNWALLVNVDRGVYAEREPVREPARKPIIAAAGEGAHVL